MHRKELAMKMEWARDDPNSKQKAVSSESYGVIKESSSKQLSGQSIHWDFTLLGSRQPSFPTNQSHDWTKGGRHLTLPKVSCNSQEKWEIPNQNKKTINSLTQQHTKSLLTLKQVDTLSTGEYWMSIKHEWFGVVGGQEFPNIMQNLI